MARCKKVRSTSPVKDVVRSFNEIAQIKNTSSEKCQRLKDLPIVSYSIESLDGQATSIKNEYSGQFCSFPANEKYSIFFRLELPLPSLLIFQV